MLFNFALLASLLYAPAVVAGSRQHHSSFLHRLEGSTEDSSTSTNWAGAFITKDPGALKIVEGTFIVPGVSGPRNSAASIWVGIDGNTCRSGLLQTGINLFPGNAYQAWYEWWPNAAVNFDGISFDEGDKVRLTVIAYTTKKGYAKIENLSKRHTVETQLSAPANSALCMKDAEWIVEDFEEIDSTTKKPFQVPFAYFDPVKITDAKAVSPDHQTYGLDQASPLNMVDKNNNTVLAAVSIYGNMVTVVREW